MALTNAAVIVIVLVCCLSSVSLAAAMFGHYSIARNPQWSPSIDQQRYMRELRLRNLKALLWESTSRADLMINEHEGFTADPEAQSVEATDSQV
ncbi:hypothetical protein N7533_003341 [Penicillium manginii]|uniref:uncharacterized protein n=1 Tax=Penicillium manginii TaxID=203109 RepID=UPI0025495D9E|nr:uncharacterized protein N7533_003341 [Penicillium manginii]KAJ5764660.1 hypothetical protein N7533_003341 [Penicillium manginii]